MRLRYVMHLFITRFCYRFPIQPHAERECKAPFVDTVRARSMEEGNFERVVERASGLVARPVFQELSRALRYTIPSFSEPPYAIIIQYGSHRVATRRRSTGRMLPQSNLGEAHTDTTSEECLHSCLKSPDLPNLVGACYKLTFRSTP